MVRAELAKKKVARASSWLDSADALLSRPLDEFLADGKGRDLAAFYLFLAIQECIDLAAHWIADAGWTPPESASGTFDVLAQNGVVSQALADSMRLAAGLHNRIAHGYALLDHRRLHAEASAGLSSLRGFLSSLSRGL